VDTPAGSGRRSARAAAAAVAAAAPAAALAPPPRKRQRRSAVLLPPPPPSVPLAGLPALLGSVRVPASRGQRLESMLAAAREMSWSERRESLEEFRLAVVALELAQADVEEEEEE
jgi:hypothetical protein